jgi:hypothetical protein
MGQRWPRGSAAPGTDVSGASPSWRRAPGGGRHAPAQRRARRAVDERGRRSVLPSGGAVGSPRYATMSWNVGGSVMKATTMDMT